MTTRKISAGGYDLIFNEGRKWISGMHLVGPCTALSYMGDLRIHLECDGHMYPLSAEEFRKIYDIMKRNKSKWINVRKLSSMQRRLERESYIGLAMVD
jgi:hypothetical protein